jgi:hypothetical protein
MKKIVVVKSMDLRLTEGSLLETKEGPRLMSISEHNEYKNGDMIKIRF